jgi:hypothetical protein
MSQTLNVAAFLRDHGMTVAENAQERRHAGWQDSAYAWLVNYTHEHHEFTTELVRAYAEGNGLPPSTGFAWGAVIKRAVRDGLIEPAGFEASSNPSRHLGTVRIWRAKRIQS